MTADQIRELVRKNGLIQPNGVITKCFETEVFLAEIAAQLAEQNERQARMESKAEIANESSDDIPF